MKAWVQRVSEASVTIDGEVVSSIGQGFLVLLGVTHSDTVREADDIAARIATLRIFEDANGKSNLSVEDVGGSVIVVSQFTLDVLKPRVEFVFFRALCLAKLFVPRLFLQERAPLQCVHQRP